MGRWFPVLTAFLAGLSIGIGCMFFSRRGVWESAKSSKNWAKNSAATYQEEDRPPLRAAKMAKQFQALRSHEQCTTFDQRLITGLMKVTSAPLDALKDPAFVADLIREVGLVKDDRPLYGDEGVYQINYTEEFHGHVGMYQLPEQMACALTTLSSMKVATFMEVGVFSGWTGVFSTAYLSRFAAALDADFASIGLDIADFQSPCIKLAMQIVGRTFVQLPKAKTHSDNLVKLQRKAALLAHRHGAASSGRVDLCFVDGDHSYKGVHGDVTALFESCRIFMLHDVVDDNCKGVRRQWNELKENSSVKEFWECIQQPQHLPEGTKRLGIGIAGLM